MWSNQLEEQLRVLLGTAEGIYGVAVHHLETGWEFFHLPEERFYAASIIKVPIMAAVYKQAELGLLSLSDAIAVRPEDRAGGSGVLGGSLTSTRQIAIYDLVVLMIIESDNTATNVLIDRLGAEAIQAAMREWGLEGSRFRHKLQIASTARGEPNEITAADMNRLLKQLALGQIVSPGACLEMVGVMKRQRFNDGIPSLLPEPLTDGNTPAGLSPAKAGLIGGLPTGAALKWELAHKTGFVPGVEHDMGLLYCLGSTFAVTVLSKDIPDRAAAKLIQGQIGLLLYEAAGAYGG